MDRNTVIIIVDTVANGIMLGINIMGLQFLFAGRVSDLEIAMFAVYFWAVQLFASPMWGSLSDVLGNRKQVLLITVLATSLINYLYFMFPSYLSIVVLQMILAFFVSAYTPVALALFTAGKKSEELGRRSSLFNLSRSIGFLLSGYLGAFVLYFYSDRFLFVASSIVVFASFLISLALDEPYNGNAKKFSEGIKKVFRMPGEGFIKNGNGHFVFIATALRHASVMGLFSLVFTYLTNIGMDKAVISAVSSFNTLVQVLTMYLFGYLADKIGRKPLYTIGILLSAFTPLAFIYATNPLNASIAFAYIGISYSVMISGLTPYFKEIAPKGREGEALSFLQTSRAIGNIIGPPVAGLAATYADYKTMFLTLTLIGLLGFIVSLKGKETLPQKMVKDDKKALIS